MLLNITVNQTRHSLAADADRRLIDILREDLGLTGSKEGCGEGECGACTVVVNGRAVDSCITLAAGLEGAEIVTIEGLAQNGELDAIQNAFVEETAIQCGYCTPGMVMSAWALLAQNPNPSETEIQKALAGNICRCSGYRQILRAVQRSAEERREPPCP